MVKFVLRSGCVAASVLFVSGCSPQWIKDKVKSRVAAGRAARPKTHVPTRLEWRSRPEMPKAALPALWSFKILDLRTDKDNPKGILTYDAPHAMAMHLFIVSRDGQEYAHLYPEPRDYGSFLVHTVIPRAGSYQFFVDFTPIDGFATVHSQKFIVSGDDPLKPAKLTPDTVKKGWLEARVQAREENAFEPKPDAPSYIVQLRSANWQAKQEQQFTARVLDENQAPVTNLQLHLGGAAYGIAISEDGNQFVRLEAAARESSSIGATFKGTFPTPGTYRIWLEFRHEDKIIVAPFTIRVAPSRSSKDK
jgi:hypothetical protein